MKSSAWETKSREVELSCDRDGIIRELDARASRILGAKNGMHFSRLAAPGVEDKVARFLRESLQAELDCWELPLLIGERPVSFVLCAKPGAEPGTISVLGMQLPPGYDQTVEQLTQSMNEVVDLNRELSRQKREIEKQKSALEVAYRELDESNRGVLSLHAELADRAQTITRSSDVKSRLLANVSHELRTPLHTIRGLAGLLLDGVDGMLNDEQKKQILFIRTASEELSQLVTDLLDLSKAEAGKVTLRPEKLNVRELFAALRGQLRPLLDADRDVELIFEEESPIALETDQGKISQILRNLVSNALKFTEQGSVRVRATEQNGSLRVEVEDTGIGIGPEHYDVIFEEFGQVDGRVQRLVKGTGLGLALSRKLAELLCGTLALERSEVGRGSLFVLTIPLVHPEVRELADIQGRTIDPTTPTVLVVEDDRKTIFVYEKYLAMAGFQVVAARSTDEARRLIEKHRPEAIVLDIMLDGESSWAFLSSLKSSPETKDIPVLVVTVTNKEQKARALGADEFWLKPIDQGRLIRKLRVLTKEGTPARLLIIDDDPASRYIIRKTLAGSPYSFAEAASGAEGVQLAQELRPSVILLDFLLRGETAFDVLDELKADPRTRSIPVIIITSHLLPPEERERLAAQTESILSKDKLSKELAINRIRDALLKAKSGESRDG
jgi:signal transduction histidine kinase/CheY-like chemotaxis protein